MKLLVCVSVCVWLLLLLHPSPPTHVHTPSYSINLRASGSVMCLVNALTNTHTHTHTYTNQHSEELTDTHTNDDGASFVDRYAFIRSKLTPLQLKQWSHRDTNPTHSDFTSNLSLLTAFLDANVKFHDATTHTMLHLVKRKTKPVQSDDNGPIHDLQWLRSLTDTSLIQQHTNTNTNSLRSSLHYRATAHTHTQTQTRTQTQTSTSAASESSESGPPEPGDKPFCQMLQAYWLQKCCFTESTEAQKCDLLTNSWFDRCLGIPPPEDAETLAVPSIVAPED